MIKAQNTANPLQSWGTKGSDKASEDLGLVKSDDKNEVTVMVPTEQKDLNALYENEMRIITRSAGRHLVEMELIW
jgi:chitin synthase